VDLIFFIVSILFDLGPLVILFGIVAVIGLSRRFSGRREIEVLRERVNALEIDLRLLKNAQAAPAAAPPASAAPAASPISETPPAPEAAGEEPAPTPASPEPPRPTAPVPPIPAAAPQPPRGADFEEKLGSRWAVWVGGVALALGGLFLVRYSIEQNLLSPGTRIALGGLFALALIAAGEWLRRREQGFALPGIPSANVPSVLTAAGTCTAFATAYGAYALYELIGPATAFVLLGLIAVLTLVASTLHGPALAALGLLGAMGSPLLVSSDSPQPWALVIYLAFVALPAYGVARFRPWRWLALAAAIGALLWSLPIFALDGAGAFPTMAHVALQAALAAFFLVADPYRGAADEEARVDLAAGGVLLAFALSGVIVSASTLVGDGRPVFVGILALVLLGAGFRFAPGAPAAAWAALLAVGSLLVWPIRTLLGNDPENLFYQSGDAFAVRPDALGLFLTLAILLPPVIAGVSLLRLAISPALRLSVAAWYAGAATIGPLLALVAAYWRIAEFERSLSFALAAGVLALGFVSAAVWLDRRPDRDGQAVRLALGATASAALAALALGLTFALDKGMLTVAFALAALGTAWVADRAAIPALRYAVGAIGAIIAARLVWDPTIVGGDPGPVIFNWLLWGYGVPAVSFLLASRLLARTGRDRIVQLTESLGIVFAAFLVFFEIRHAVHGGDPLKPDFALVEAGLLATESLAFAILLTRLDFRRVDPVYRWGSLIFKIASFALAAGGLLLVENPLLTNDPISGGVVLNSLILAYLLPGLLAAALALVERDARPRFYALSSAILSLVLQWAYVALEIRRVFLGPRLGIWRGFTQGEQWSYSVALLAIGIALLGFGLLRDNRFARLASAVYLVAAVLKVFIVDLANLEGVMRALSFIGLGLVLIGIGLVYQRLLARRPSNAAISS
jgi:uncharacterized membrane protein